jgi:DNA-binding transcriptional MerR regulator
MAEMRSFSAGNLSIGDLARRSGVNIQTIRYYEQIGLLAAPPRTEGGQRRYGSGAVQRLGFIRHARDLGFDIAAIRELIALAGEPDRPCVDADRIALAQLETVKTKIAGLKLLQKELERMLHQCAHGTISDCRVVETLGDHALCTSGHAARDRH